MFAKVSVWFGTSFGLYSFLPPGGPEEFWFFFLRQNRRSWRETLASVTVISVVVLRYGSMLPICITSQLKLPEHSASDLVPHDSAAQRLQVKTMPWPLSSTPQAELWRWSSAALVPAPVTPPFCGLLTNIVATTTWRLNVCTVSSLGLFLGLWF